MSTRIDSLFYELEVKAQGFEDGIKSAQAAGTKFTEFMKAHPVAVAGLFTAALAGAALQLVKMAQETNKAIGIIADRVPGATGKIGELRQVVDGLAIQYRVSQDQIIATMDAASKAGVRNAEELIQVTRAATATGRVLGKEGKDLIGGLDAALDIFGISAKDSTALMVQFLSAAEGRTSVEELLATIELLAPALQGTGLDAVTTTNALAALIDQGFKAGKPLIAQFNRELQNGIPRIRELAAEAAGPDGAEGAVDKFTAALKRNTETIEGEHARAQASLRAQLTELGTLLEPKASLIVQGLTSVVQGMRGLNFGTAASNAMLNAFVKEAQEAALKADLSAKAFENLGVTGGIAAGEAGKLTDTLIEAKGAASDLGSKSVADLTRYKVAIEASARAGKLDAENGKLLSAVVKELTSRRKEGAAAAEDAARRSLASRQLQFDVEVEMTRATITLAEAQRREVELLEIQFQERMAGLQGKDLKVTLARLDQARKELTAKWTSVYDVLDKAIVPKMAKTETAEAKLITTTKTLSGAILAQDIAYGALSVALDDQIEKQRAHREAIAQTAFDVAGAVDVFGALAKAIGQSTPELELVVGGIADVADAIGQIAGGNIAGGLVQGISGLSGVISGLFGGESESARQVRLGLERTRDKLEEHRRTLGDLIALSQPGAKVSNLAGGVGDILAEIRAKQARGGVAKDLAVVFDEDVRKALVPRGLSLEDLEELAEQLGVDLRMGGANIQIAKLEELLQQIDARDSGFAETFQGQLDLLTRRWNIIGADVGRKLSDLVGLAGDPRFGSSALAGLKDFDLSTEEGRTGATQFLADLLERGDLTNEDLGGLNLQDFRDLLGEIAGLIRELPEVVTGEIGDTGGMPPPTTGTPPPPAEDEEAEDDQEDSADSTFTPSLETLNWERLLEQGDAKIGLLQELVALNTQMLPLVPPAVSANFGAGGAAAGGPVSVGTINIVLPPGARTDPDSLAQEILGALARAARGEATDTSLAARLYIEQSAVGRFPPL